MKILIQETSDHYRKLGVWVAQLSGKPQSRSYGGTSAEALGNWVMVFGKDNGIELNPEGEKIWEKVERVVQADSPKTSITSK